MMTSLVYFVIVLAVLAILFLALSKARSPKFAFLAICWMPLAGMVFVYALQNQLGYAGIGYLLVDVLASIVIAGLGANQCIAARRQKTAMWHLILGTVLSASPLAWAAAAMLLY